MDRRQQSVLVHVADVGCDCCVLAAKFATLISSLLNSEAPVNAALWHMSPGVLRSVTFVAAL